MFRHSILLLLAISLIASACRNPDVREDAIVEPPDTAVVDEPLIDPAQLDPRIEPGRVQTADELEARRTILRDPTVQEAAVVTVGIDTVLVTAVLLEPGVADAELKAEQFVITALRHLERPEIAPGEDPLAPSRFTYLVTIRDAEGEVLFEGTKPRELDGLVEQRRER